MNAMPVSVFYEQKKAGTDWLRLSERASEQLTAVTNLVQQISALKSCSSAPFELWQNQEVNSKQKRLAASLRLNKLACAAIAAVVSELDGIFTQH